MPLARVVVVEYILTETGDSLFMLEEGDGGHPVQRWLPWENPDPCLCLAQFVELADARGYALGIDLIRAEAGILEESVCQIEQLRRGLDRGRPGRPKQSEKPPQPPRKPLSSSAWYVPTSEPLSA